MMPVNDESRPRPIFANEEFTQTIYHDFSAALRDTDSAEDFEFSDIQIARMNRLLNRYIEDVDKDGTTRLRLEFSEAKSHLQKLDKSLQSLSTLWVKTEKNSYVTGLLIDSYCGKPKVQVPEYDNCIDELGAFGKQLEKVALAVQQAEDLPIDRGAQPVFKAGGQTDQYIQELLKGLGRITEEILRAAREEYEPDSLISGDEEYYSILREILHLVEIDLSVKTLRNRLPVSR